MTIFSYKTIEGPAEGFYKEKGSKFISLAFPVSSEEEIKSKLDDTRKKYFDARHHCYAFMVGPAKKTFRASDDGEPNHSAGDPILGQIRSKELTDILIIVVRYFGGTKLGVGGLIQAYRTAAEDALQKAIISEREVYKLIELNYPYSSTSEVMKLIKDFELEVQSQSFEENGTLMGKLKARMEERAVEKLNYLQAMGHTIKYSIID
jgi:uncharacterized YigZ family protein